MPNDPVSDAPRHAELSADGIEVAFRHAPTGMAVIDLDGRALTVSPVFCTLLGRPETDLLGRSLVDLLQPRQVEAVRQWIDRAAGRAPGRPVRAEAWLTRPDGTRRWLVVDAVMLADVSGRSRYGLVQLHDRTESKTMEEALRGSQEELSALVDSAPVAIYMVDLDGRVLLWNPAAENTFGWSAAEAVGEILPIVQEDRLEEFAAFRRRILDGHPLIGVVVERRRRDGQPIDLELWTSAVHDADGRPTAIMAVAVDATERLRAEAALRTSEHRWQAVFRNISDTVTIIDRDGEVKLTTGQTKKILGYPRGYWHGRSLFDLGHPDEADRARDLLAELLAEPGREVASELRGRHAAGHWEHLSVTGVNLLEDPDVGALVITTSNITAVKLVERLLTDQAHILELIARNAPLEETLGSISTMVEQHADGSRAGILLLEGERLVPRGGHSLPLDLLHRITTPEIAEPEGAAVLEVTQRPVEVRDTSTDPLVRHCRDVLRAHGLLAMSSVPIVEQANGDVLGAITTFYDSNRGPTDHERRVVEVAANLVSIAVKRQAAESRLAHQALHDDLTGLPNRTLLMDRLEQAVTRAETSGRSVAVLFIDLDRFKVVNDSLGHGPGDELLVAFADRLRAAVRPEDTIARFGGDEFVVLCEQPAGSRTIFAIAERLDRALTEPFNLDGGEVFLTASMGLVIGAEPSPDALLRNADAAMYRAKERGRNRLEVFDDRMRAAAVARLNLGNDLRRALERSEFTVLHQPIVDVATTAVVGSEALVRWNHPTRGVLKPEDFMAVTEETGMVVTLGEWVLDESLRQIRALADRAASPSFSLSVNLSARQLGIAGMADRVAERLAAHDWPPDRLCLELTESVLMDDLDVTLGALLELKAHGVRLSIDDFGTGYSSLTYLQRFPVDLVKIDQSFVAGIDSPRKDDDERGTIVRAVVSMAHALGLRVVAEGVERAEQLALLRALDCDLAQGYLFSEPVTADAFVALLDEPPRWG